MKCPTCNQELPVSPESVEDKLHLLIVLVNIAERKCNNSSDWEAVYDFVFSPMISRRINALMRELDIDTNYYDPDTSYEEDVRAYISDRREKVDRLIDFL